MARKKTSLFNKPRGPRTFTRVGEPILKTEPIPSLPAKHEPHADGAPFDLGMMKPPLP